MTPTIRIDDDIWEHLKNNSSFVDTPSDVLRRLLSLPKKSIPKPSMPTPNGTKYLLRADRDYASVPITSYEFEGRRFNVYTYKDVLVGICMILRSRHGEKFDDLALTLRGKKRSYFSRTNSGLLHPKAVPSGGSTNKDLYIESNLSATSIMGLCQYLIRSFGHDVSTFKAH